jgi:hypothetical protein
MFTLYNLKGRVPIEWFWYTLSSLLSQIRQMPFYSLFTNMPSQSMMEEEGSSSGRLACKMCMTSYTLTLVDDYNTKNHNHLHVQNHLEVAWPPGNMFWSTQKLHSIEWFSPPIHFMRFSEWKGCYPPSPHRIHFVLLKPYILNKRNHE